jgi:uncharacterized protein
VLNAFLAGGRETPEKKSRTEMPATAAPEVFTDITVDPFVRGRLHRPAKPNGSGLVLTHGSGGNCNAPILIAMSEGFAEAGFLVLRCDLPFRQDRPYGPPGRGDGKRDRAGLKNAVAALKNEGAKHVFLGGHSYGGRQCSMLCAEESNVVAGLLLTSYPLHLPGKTELRIQHLPNLQTPALFVQGTGDPFGSIAELEQAIKLIPAKTKLLVIDGTGHDLGFKGKAKREGLPTEVLAEFQNFLGA